MLLQQQMMPHNKISFICQGLYSLEFIPSFHHHMSPNTMNKTPYLRKKLQQLKGLWETKKEILGWYFDGEAYTIQLPKDKEHRLQDLISNVYRKKAVLLKIFQNTTREDDSCWHRHTRWQGPPCPNLQSNKV